MKTILGLAVIALGVFFEVMWLGFCFGSIIIGIILLIFAPRILFFPFNFFLVIGLSIMKGISYKQSAEFNYRQHSQNQNSYANQRTSLDKYYEILESKPTDEFILVKKNYRRLIKEFHYDSIASKDLPEDMLKFAEQKTKDLNEAYSAIKSVKN